MEEDILLGYRALAITILELAVRATEMGSRKNALFLAEKLDWFKLCFPDNYIVATRTAKKILVESADKYGWD